MSVEHRLAVCGEGGRCLVYVVGRYGKTADRIRNVGGEVPTVQDLVVVGPYSFVCRGGRRCDISVLVPNDGLDGIVFSKRCNADVVDLTNGVIGFSACGPCTTEKIGKAEVCGVFSAALAHQLAVKVDIKVAVELHEFKRVLTVRDIVLGFVRRQYVALNRARYGCKGEAVAVSVGGCRHVAVTNARVHIRSRAEDALDAVACGGTHIKGALNDDLEVFGCGKLNGRAKGIGGVTGKDDFTVCGIGGRLVAGRSKRGG